MESRIVQSKAKCPKCSSNNLQLAEHWEGHSITWDQRNGEFDRNDGTLEPGGPVSMHGKCYECGHLWRFRKTPQIDWLIKD